MSALARTLLWGAIELVALLRSNWSHPGTPLRQRGVVRNDGRQYRSASADS